MLGASEIRKRLLHLIAVAVVWPAASNSALQLPLPSDSLRPGGTVSLDIPAAQTRVLTLAIDARTFVRLTVDGGGALVRLSVAPRDGAPIDTRDRRAGVRTPLTWAHVTTDEATMLVSVTSLERVAVRRITFETTRPRPAVPGDAARVAAVQAIARAERFEAAGAS